jgi:hypothetical protein
MSQNCKHISPESWVKKQGSNPDARHCPGCGKFMGYVVTWAKKGKKK